MNVITMTATKQTSNPTGTLPIDNSQELRDALFHAICLLDHAHPENDTDHRDVAAGRELKKLRDLMNQQAYAPAQGKAATTRRAG
jgi:hypothetical protein